MWQSAAPQRQTGRSNKATKTRGGTGGAGGARALTEHPNVGGRGEPPEVDRLRCHPLDRKFAFRRCNGKQASDDVTGHINKKRRRRRRGWRD